MAEDAGKSPSGRVAPDHGPTVDPVTREVRRSSVSQLQTADESTNEGCLRKWWYDKIMGLTEPSTRSQETGTEHHGYMEHHLVTGEKRLPDRIVRNLHFVPKPGPDLLVEHPTIPTMSDGSSGLAHAPLRAAGIAIVGYIDLIHGRCENPGTTDILDAYDPPGTIAVVDWKFTGSMEYAVAPGDLPKKIQMAGYGKYRFDVGWPGDLVRLAHGYFPERGRGELRTIRVDRDRIERSWEHAESVMRSIIDVARETDPDKVPGNRRACNAYRKKCMHAAGGYCTAGMHSSLRSIVGASVAPPPVAPGDLIMPVSILDRLRGGAQTPTPVAVTAALTPNSAAVVPADDGKAAAEAAKEKARAELAAMQAEEKLLREAKAFETTVDSVAAHNMGLPRFDGRALELIKKAKPSRPDAFFAGMGTLGGTPEDPFIVTDPAELAGLLVELDALAAQKAEALKNAPPPIATPAPTPAPAPAAASTVPAILPPEAPVRTPAPVPATVPTAPAAAQAPTPVGQNAEGAGEATKAPRKPRAAKTADKPEGVAPAPTGGLVLYVDCVVEGVATTSLHGLIDEWCAALAAGTKPPSADIRCPTEGSPLSYNKWPGALTAFIREAAAELPDGAYAIDSRGGAIAETVIEALRPIIRARGGVLVRGYR
jgi:hypothetical protein